MTLWEVGLRLSSATHTFASSVSGFLFQFEIKIKCGKVLDRTLSVLVEYSLGQHMHLHPAE